MMKMSSQLLLLLPLAMGVGMAMAFQTAINSQLREYLHSPLQAALLSFLVGSMLLVVLVFVQNCYKKTIGEFLTIILGSLCLCYNILDYNEKGIIVC